MAKERESERERERERERGGGGEEERGRRVQDTSKIHPRFFRDALKDKRLVGRLLAASWPLCRPKRVALVALIVYYMSAFFRALNSRDHDPRHATRVCACCVRMCGFSYLA